ncbi:MAG TPA: PAS domain-containing protein [Azospirillum sp.]|nr:PAS domain-containing protein [Azospirillum sp.]
MAPENAGAATIDWRSVFAHSPAATCVVGADGRVADANMAMAALAGRTVTELVGRPFDLLAPLTGGTSTPGKAWVPTMARGSALLRRADGVERGVSYAVTDLDGGLRLVTLADVTDEQCFVCAVFSSREKFRTAIDDQSELICRFTPDLNVTLVNRQFAAACGMTPRRFVGLNLRAILAPETLAAVERFVREATPTAPLAASEERWPTGDGSTGDGPTSEGPVRWITWRRLAVFDAEGRLTAIQSVGRDTTQRRLAEEERIRLAAMIERSPVVGLVWRMEGNLPIEYATNNVGRLGLDRSALLSGKAGLLDLLEPEDAVAFSVWVESRREETGSRHICVRLADRGKGSRWVSVTAWRVCDGRMEAALLDVTEQRHANLALRDRERRFRAILDHTIQFIGLLTPGGRIIEVNQTALRFIGALESDIRGRLFWDTPWWTDPAGGERLRAGIVAALHGEAVRFQTTHTSPQGVTLHIDFSLTPIRDDAGEVVFLVAEGHDITGMKEAQAALLAATREAEEANRSKTQFLAVMSHELRTPLNAILGYSEVMQNALFGPVGNPRYNGYAEAIHNSGRHLLGIIDDILEVSRIELGVLELSEDDAGIAELVDRAAQILTNRGREAGVWLETDVPDGLPPLRCDSRRVVQMLVNLGHNGIKFSRRGGRVRIAARSAPDGGLDLSVADTGVGIAPQDFGRVWEPFGQAAAAHVRQAGGVGLGLTITKALIEAHGGEVHLDSAPGQGTTVTLSFPAERCGAGVGAEEPLSA